MEAIKSLISEYASLHLSDVINYDRFNQFFFVYHSCGIAGSTLTGTETRVLLEYGITPKGKPLEHSLMAKDHYESLLFVLNARASNLPISIDLIQSINAKVMRHTGFIYSTNLGEVDTSKGCFRKDDVGIGDTHFANFEKVEQNISDLVSTLNKGIVSSKTIEERLHLSFLAHLKLVNIHPFYDGNGRTGRLLMNYLQALFELPLAIVYQEDKVDYYAALQQARIQENDSIFIAFMNEQYKKFLRSEIQQFRKDMSADVLKNDRRNNGSSLLF